jgi:hypothetical protein
LAHVLEVRKAGLAIEAVVADADYGTTTAFRTGLERMGLRYAVAVRGVLHPWLPGAVRSGSLAAIERTLRPRALRRVTWGHGTKGPLAARFAVRRVRLRHGRGDRWVLFERSLADDARKYEVLRPKPGADRLAEDPWPVGSQSLGHRCSWNGVGRRTSRARRCRACGRRCGKSPPFCTS